MAYIEWLFIQSFSCLMYLATSQIKIHVFEVLLSRLHLFLFVFLIREKILHHNAFCDGFSHPSALLSNKLLLGYFHPQKLQW